jgi:endo-1,4-beta-xylanase
MLFSRRRLLRLCPAALMQIPVMQMPAMQNSVHAGPSPVQAEAVAEGRLAKDGLAKLAMRTGLIFGSAAATSTLTDPKYRRLYVTETQSITTDWALKFDALRPNESDFNFEAADALIAFATTNGIQKRGHTLIWNENAPDWLKAKSAREKAMVFDAHIERVVQRYVGELQVWDVVNEPFWPGHRLPGGFRQGPWYEAFGPNYIKRALTLTAKYDPKVKLAINEAHTERSDELGLFNRAALLRLIDDLQHAGVPLHAVGLQGHLQPQWPHDDDGYVAFLHEIEARRLEIHITELDIDDSSLDSATKAVDLQAADRVHAYLSKVLTVSGVKSLNTWELADCYSWYRDPALLRKAPARRLPRPLPFDDLFQRKPMWAAIARALSERKLV